jgi:cytochrome b6-f complex iron-sulfur subunit
MHREPYAVERRHAIFSREVPMVAPGPTRLSRRRWLLWALRAAGVLAGTSLGCGRGKEPPEDGRLRVPLAELSPGQRVRRWHDETPIEIVRLGDSIVARSLLCTHFGCEVEWQPQAEKYQCPCHDGSFDADGNVLSGPPSRPLRRLPVEVEKNVVLIGPMG